MKKDKVFMSKLKDPKKNHTAADEEYYIIDMIRMSYTQVVHIMIKLEADLNIDSKK
jgi:hypothetical protein